MDCTETRSNMLSARRGTLPGRQADAVRAHLVECATCRHADAADAELTGVLERLPWRPAPDALRRRIESAARERRRRGMAMTLGVAALAVAAAALLVLWPRDRSETMYTEAVNDQLRLLYSGHPIEIESGGIHQVKPWFAGKLDFAPVVRFAGDEDFPLKGGSVAYFLDRKAAAFVFARRLHTITLFVFPSQGLPWPSAASEPLGTLRAQVRTTRGFQTLLWQDGDLGYALVSDASLADLRDLGARIVSAP